MQLVQQLKRTAASAVDAVKAVAGSPKAFFNETKDTISGANAAAIDNLAHKGTKNGVVGGIFKGGINTGAWIIKKPIEVGAKLTQKGFNGIAGFYRKAPLIAVPVTIIAGFMGVSGMVRRHAEKRTQETLANSYAEAQAQMIAAQPQGQLPAPTAEAPIYKNNPEASQAFVDARKAADLANGTAGASQGTQAAALASRQAVGATEAAASPAI